MIYVTQARPDVLISATDRGYLADLLGRMDRHGGSRALPDSLPEWRHLDPNARIWGVRHFDIKDAESDPTSPSGGWAVQDNGAVGLVFSCDPSKHRAIISHLSKSKDATGAFGKFWLGMRPEVREVGPGLVKFSASLEPGQFERVQTDWFSRLSAALGHGLCL